MQNLTAQKPLTKLSIFTHTMNNIYAEDFNYTLFGFTNYKLILSAYFNSI